MGEPHACGRVGNADQVVARRAFDLAAGISRIAFQGLVAMSAVELEFGCVYRLHPLHAQTGLQEYIEPTIYFLGADCACKTHFPPLKIEINAASIDQTSVFPFQM